MINKAFEVFITYIQVIIWVWFVSSYFGYKYKGMRRIIGFVAAVNVITIEIVCPPSKNGHRKASKNGMNRSLSFVFERRPHLFHGSLDNEPLPT